MIIAVTHGVTGRWPNKRTGFFPYPAHKAESLLCDLFAPMKSIISSARPKFVACGSGLRFRETYWVFRSILRNVPVKYFQELGGSDFTAVIRGKTFVIMPPNGIVRPQNYCSIADTPGFNAWQFLKEAVDLPYAGNKFVVTGSQFLKALRVKLDMEHTSACLFKINMEKKSIVCLVKKEVPQV